MSRIEGMLRDTFRERVATGPAVEAIADRAIADGTRRRRSRTAFASIAATLSVVLVGFGLVSFTMGRAPDPVSSNPATDPAWLPTRPITELPVDVVVDSYLYRAGGGVLSLAPIVPESCDGGHCISGVWRVPDGHLAAVHDADAPAGASVLWHVPEFGSPTVVVDGDGALVVNPGTTQRPGVQVVWTDDGRLHLGAYGDGRVTEVVSTPDPVVEVVELTPRAVVADAVVLSAPDSGLSSPGSGGGADIWDVWFPDRGDYQPATYPVIGLHGTTVDGELIIGWHHPPGDPLARCLSEMVPEEFEPVRSRCPSPFRAGARIHPSPDGRWWLVVDWFPVAATGRLEPGMALFDSEGVWAGMDPVRTWPSPGSDFDGIWLDAQTFAAVNRASGTAVTVFVDGRPDDTVTLPTPGPTAQVSVVPDLR